MREAMGFLTVLGGATTPTPRAWRWFPVVGALVGAAVGTVWWATGEVLAILPAAVCAVAADLVLTGMLHVDGLADAADGLLPHADRARRLEIMRKPDIGAYGVAVVVLFVVARVAGFTARPASIALVAALWCASRTVVAVAPAWLPYARDAGLATPMLATRVAWWPVLALPVAAAVGWLAIGVEGAVGVAAVVAASAIVLLFARRQIGGFTGDVLGAAIVVGETVGLVVAGARW
jgi:adenosylcobinamide-GDP ribazoletransferase